jgi:excinuclease UvrABC ATPase subunit
LAQGFLRIMNGEGVARIEACAAKSLHSAYVVVDRLKNPKKSHIRLIEALNLGLKLGGGVVFVQEDGNGARCDLQKFSSPSSVINVTLLMKSLNRCSFPSIIP